MLLEYLMKPETQEFLKAAEEFAIWISKLSPEELKELEKKYEAIINPDLDKPSGF